MNKNDFDLVSVIIPVYNVANYVEKCIQSIMTQSYSHIEIILVDDGSNDGSAEVLDRYSAMDSRIKVFHKLNGGQSSARNHGIRNANGDYYMFVDSDDYVAPDFIEKMLEAARREDADIVFCNFYSHYKNINAPSSRLSQFNEARHFSQEEYLANFYQYTGAYSYVWNKIYKKDIFDGLEFVENIKCEDAQIMLYIIDKCKSIYYIPDILYFYRRRRGSTMGGKKEELLFSDMTWLENHMNVLETTERYYLLAMAEKAYLHKMLIGFQYCSKESRKIINRKLKRQMVAFLKRDCFGFLIKAKYALASLFPFLYGNWYERKYFDNNMFWD